MLTFVLGHATHDLSGLRTGIIGDAELLLAEAKLDDPASADIREIIRSAEAMVPILRRMSALAGRSTGGGERCDFVEVVSEAVAQEEPTRPDLRLHVADAGLAVNLLPDNAMALVRAVLAAAQSAVPTGPIEVELRAIPRLPSDSSQLAHVRLRVTGEAPEGLRSRPWEPQSPFRNAVAREGVLMSEVTDGRIKIDLWLRQSRLNQP